jgi:hypothetical protein
MADYLYSLLMITGEAEAVDDFIERAMGEIHQYQRRDEALGYDPEMLHDLCFHALYPVPEDILASPFDPVGYEWETEHWGVKWGTNDSQLEIISPTEILYTFTTPWGFPIPFFDKVAADFPHLRFERKSIDPANSWVAGSTWQWGKMTESWERGSSEEEYEQLEMAWKGDLPLARVLGNLDEQ